MSVINSNMKVYKAEDLANYNCLRVSSNSKIEEAHQLIKNLSEEILKDVHIIQIIALKDYEITRTDVTEDIGPGFTITLGEEVLIIKSPTGRVGINYKNKAMLSQIRPRVKLQSEDDRKQDWEKILKKWRPKKGSVPSENNQKSFFKRLFQKNSKAAPPPVEKSAKSMENQQLQRPSSKPVQMKGVRTFNGFTS